MKMCCYPIKRPNNHCRYGYWVALITFYSLILNQLLFILQLHYEVTTLACWEDTLYDEHLIRC